MQRVALVRRTEDGAAQMPYPAHLFAGEAGHAAVGVTFGEENAVETVTDTVALAELPVPAVLMPATVYAVVLVGVTVQVSVVFPAQVPPVQV